MKKKTKRLGLILLTSFLLISMLMTVACSKPDEKKFKLDKTEVTMEILTSQMLVPIYDGIDEDLVEWTSSNTSVAEVDDGVVSSVGIGTATITATYKKQSATCAITVVNTGALPTIVVDETVNLYAGNTYQLSPSINFKGNDITDGLTFNYTSSSNVVSVSSTGLITANSVGFSSVTLSINYLGIYVSSTVAVNVLEDVQTYVYYNDQILTNNLVEISYGQTYDFTIKSFENSQQVTQVSYEFIESAEDVINLTEEQGVYTVAGVNAGETIITVKTNCNGSTFNTYLTVKVNKNESTISKAVVDLSTSTTEEVSFNVSANLEAHQGLKLIVDQTEIAVKGVSGQTVTVAKSDLVAGAYSAVLDNNNVALNIANFVVADKVLKQADVANLKTTLEANANGYYILGEDLDFASAGTYTNDTSLFTSTAFTGVIDGQGFGFKNLTVEYYFIKSMDDDATIKNLYIDLTLTAPDNSKENAGFISASSGATITAVKQSLDNIFMDVSYANSGTNNRRRAGLLALNGNCYITNCVVNMVQTASDITYTASLAGHNYGGAKEINSYAITNGANIALVLSGTQFVENCSSYLTKGAFLEESSFDSANGWSLLWDKTSDGLCFGNRLVISSNNQTYTLSFNGYSAVQDYTAIAGELMTGLPAVPTFNGLSGTWTVDGVEITENSLYSYDTDKTAVAVYDASSLISKTLSKNDYTNDYNNFATVNAMVSSYGIGTIKKVMNVGSTDNILDAQGKINLNSITVGDKYLVLETESGVQYKIALTVADKVFMQKDVATFASIIEAKKDGYFVLGEDLDFATVTDFEPIIDGPSYPCFTGTFDGRGFAMTNLVVNKKTNGTKYGQGSVFGIIKNATIKNVYVEYTAPDVNGGIGLVGDAEGASLISNVYVKATISVTTTSNAGVGGVLGWLYDDTIVENCIADVNFAGSTDFAKAGSIVGISYSKIAKSINNCYAITNGATMSYTTDYTEYGGGTVVNQNTNPLGVPVNCANYETGSAMLESATFNSADGWNSYWQVKADGLYFGNKLVVAKA